jgi:NADH dehydrogenase
VAWLLRGIVHIFFLIGFRNRMAVFLKWIWAWLTYGRGSRLITGDTTPLFHIKVSTESSETAAHP